MPNVFKPSGAKVTDSSSRRFWNARTQLTLAYTAILAVMLLVASSISYSAFSAQLRHRFENAPPNPLNQPIPLQIDGRPSPRPEDVLRDLVTTLLIVNSLLLVLAMILSYWLAGVTLEPIEEAYHRQRRFLSDASHELRTPLAILQADTENALANTRISTAEKERALSTLEEIQRMSSIVKDLLTLSRLDETEFIKTTLEPINIQPTLSKLIERFQPLATQRNIKLKFTAPKEEHLTIRASEELLTQSLGNVIKNAIQYNQPNGSVVVELASVQKHVVITIRDTGIGMASEDVDKVFERFYRVDKSRSRETGGSGLGLAIVQASIQQLHGSIEVKSALNVGTTVTLTFPKV